MLSFCVDVRSFWADLETPPVSSVLVRPRLVVPTRASKRSERVAVPENAVGEAAEPANWLSDPKSGGSNEERPSVRI